VIGVDAVSVQPLAVVVEVVTGRPHQRDVATEHADCVGDVAGHAAPMNHQVVHQETQRHLLQVLGQQVFGKSTRKPHQIVGGNRTGHRDRHEKSTLRFISSAS